MGRARIVPANPEAILLPFQARWIEDRSRLKLMEKSRQIGISWSTAYGMVSRVALQSARYDEWVSSRDEIQARLFLEDCKLWADVANIAARDLGELVLDDGKHSALVLHFANSRRIHSMSSNPDAQAGKRGSRVLDEFALHPDPRKLWSIAYPGITWGGQMEAISTHRGSKNFFNILLAAVDDDAALLEYSLIANAEYGQGVDWQTPEGGQLYAGVDIGRKKDLTVLWVVEKLGDVLYTRHYEALGRMNKSDQEKVLWPWFAKCARICIDTTGLGISWVDDAQDRFGEYRVEGVTFTPAVKEALAYPSTALLRGDSKPCVSQSCGSPANPARKLIRITPLILAVALFMEQMDSTVIATSLPAIAADIGAEPISLKLALTAYFVALAIFIPLSGWMADRFGARRIFRVAIGIFILGSISCAFSFSLGSFVGSRFLQGIGASMMTPVARLVLIRATPRNELVAAMAWLTIPALIGPMAGPPLGGFLTTYLSWQWIFWINVPIGIAGIVLATIFLPRIEPRHPRPIDFPGFVLAGIAFAGIIFGLSVISLPAIPAVAGYVSVLAGLASGLAYYRHTRRTAFPLLDPSLFGHQLFRSAIIGGSLFRIGIGAFPFLLPLMLQLAFGLNPFESGMITFVAAIGAIMSKFVAERVYAAIGFPRVLMLTAAVGSAFLAINGLFYPDTPLIYLYLSLVVGGVVRSIFFTGVNALGYADIEEHEASQATAITAVSQQLSIAFGVALAGGVLELSSSLTGGELGLADFHMAWYIVSAVALLSAVPFLRLPRDAGSHVSGHRAKPLPKPGDEEKLG